jgi:glycosyltransferase involved in cell wall biosynthesis
MNIFILPSSNKNNAYIDLLIKSLEAKNNKDVSIVHTKKDMVLEVFKQIVFGKVKRDKNILHIQWSTIIYGSKYFLKSLFSLCFNFLLIIVLKLFFRTKVVWTIHNNFAHDYSNKKVDMFGRGLLLAISDAIVAQQKCTKAIFQNKYPRKDINYLPHPNYIGAYGPIIDRDYDLGKSFGFAQNDIVLLSLGAIKKYKKNENIIKAVSEIRTKYPELKLLIIGKGDSGYVDYLNSLANNDSGIIIKNNFVPDLEIPRYLSIADCSIFYYDDSEMTSGGIVLSLSYGVPVISRDIAGAEMIDQNSGFTFKDNNELIDILSNLKSKIKNFKSSDIIDSIRQDSWDFVSEQLMKIYQRI